MVSGKFYFPQSVFLIWQFAVTALNGVASAIFILLHSNSKYFVAQIHLVGQIIFHFNPTKANRKKKKKKKTRTKHHKLPSTKHACLQDCLTV